MKKIISTFLFFFLAACSSDNSNNRTTSKTHYTKVGRSPYALLNPRFDCESFFNSVATLPDIHISILWNTFGNDFRCLERIMELENFTSLQIHLMNEVCVRNRNCGDYEILSGYTLEELDKALKVKEPNLLNKLNGYFSDVSKYVSEKLPENKVCYISPSLESEVSNSAAQVLEDLTKLYFPQCLSVAYAKAAEINSDVNELHGPKPDLKAPCLVNLDGVDINFSSRPSIAPENNTAIPSGFLWKPKSESDGKLVVLIPHTNVIHDLVLKNTSGQIIEVGRSVGRTNLSRPTYRFKKPGSAYPDNLIVKYGSSKIKIKDTSKRLEGFGNITKIEESEILEYIQRYQKICDVVYLWVYEDNCKTSRGFVDPRERTCPSNGVFEILSKYIEQSKIELSQ